MEVVVACENLRQAEVIQLGQNNCGWKHCWADEFWFGDVASLSLMTLILEVQHRARRHCLQAVRGRT
eukprot:5667828-Amphidinium_carterae.1